MTLSRGTVTVFFVILAFASTLTCANANSEGHNATAYDHWNFSPDLMCGPNCLWQISSVLGKTYSLGAIANMAGMTPEKGTTIKGMVEAAKKMQLQAESVRTNINALEKDSRIKILLLDFGEFQHYVILDKIENNEVRLLSGDKFQVLPISRLGSIWKGYAILIGPSNIYPENKMQKYIGSGIQLSGIAILIFAGYMVYRIFQKRHLA